MSAKKAPIRVTSELEQSILELLVGQDESIQEIVPFVETHQAGLSIPGRPIAVVLLLGPTGTGKTHTIESIAKVLHGDAKCMLRIDCGEFQMEHEIAKLVGAPPGYLGHRETAALLSQAALARVQSTKSNISLVLFDEIEKGSAALERLLLGICDKAEMRTGDNVTVNFESCMIFLTSNLGESEIQNALNPNAMGFTSGDGVSSDRVAQLGKRATKRKFSAAMMNRIDLQLTYKPLKADAYEVILKRLMAEWIQLVVSKLGTKAFFANISKAGKEQLLEEGVSQEYGARHLKRALQKNYINPLCKMFLHGDIKPGVEVTLDSKAGKFRIIVKDII